VYPNDRGKSSALAGGQPACQCYKLSRHCRGRPRTVRMETRLGW